MATKKTAIFTLETNKNCNINPGDKQKLLQLHLGQTGKSYIYPGDWVGFGGFLGPEVMYWGRRSVTLYYRSGDLRSYCDYHRYFVIL